jgi:hypothetical protein
MKDLCDITAANWIEQMPRVPQLRQAGSQEFPEMLKFVLPSAREELIQTLQTLCG